MRFSRQVYWSGWPFPPPGDLPDPGIKSASCALTGRFFTLNYLGSCVLWYKVLFNGSVHCKLSIRQYLLMFNIFVIICRAHIINENHFKSTWEITALAYSWKADGLCHKIWLVGHLCRHELWEESRRQCSFTGNIWAEIYKILGEGLLLPRWLPKFLIPALWKWDWES